MLPVQGILKKDALLAPLVFHFCLARSSAFTGSPTLVGSPLLTTVRPHVVSGDGACRVPPPLSVCAPDPAADRSQTVHGCSTPVRRPWPRRRLHEFRRYKRHQSHHKTDVAKKLVRRSKKQRRLQQKRCRRRRGSQLVMNGRSKNICRL